MIVIGLTGGIASGKSSVSKLLRELGAKIVDADLVARQIVEPGGEAWKEIVRSFGEEHLLEDKSINRKKLGALVFSNPEALDRLNKITHPVIIAKTKALLAKFREQGTKVAVIDAALLVETGMHTLADQVWVVDVAPEIQLQRLVKRDNISEEEALKRINSQTSSEERLKWGDFILKNDGSQEELKEKVIKGWKELTNV